MDKWVIMFKGGVETQEFFSIEMAHTFEAEGYNVYWFDLLVSQESSLLPVFFWMFKESLHVNIVHQHNSDDCGKP